MLKKKTMKKLPVKSIDKEENLMTPIENTEDISMEPSLTSNKSQELAGHHQPKMVVVDNKIVQDISKGVVIDFRP